MERTIQIPQPQKSQLTPPTQDHRFQPLLQNPIRLIRSMPQRPMRRWDFSSRQIRHSPLHIARHGPRQNTIPRCKNIQRGLRNTVPRLLRQLQIILIIDPASSIPIARTANSILLKLLHVILEFFLIEERRGGDGVFLVPDHVQLDPFLGRHKFSAAGRFASIHSP